jgi:hypothetical protein
MLRKEYLTKRQPTVSNRWLFLWINSWKESYSKYKNKWVQRFNTLLRQYLHTQPPMLYSLSAIEEITQIATTLYKG